MKKIISYITCNIATLGPIGYLPAPGTFATLATIPLVFLISRFLPTLYAHSFSACISNAESYIGLLNAEIGLFLFFFVILVGIAMKSLPAAFEKFGVADAPHIVIDELLGTLVTFYAIPINSASILIGIALFRFFDIVKPLGIKKIEKMQPQAAAIITDDLVAGVYSNIALRIIMKIISLFWV